jgi:hypothetical protein
MMDRRTACRIQADLCRERASLDIARRGQWAAEADVWDQRATSKSTLVITFDQPSGRLATAPR